FRATGRLDELKNVMTGNPQRPPLGSVRNVRLLAQRPVRSPAIKGSESTYSLGGADARRRASAVPAKPSTGCRLLLGDPQLPTLPRFPGVTAPCPSLATSWPDAWLHVSAPGPS